MKKMQTSLSFQPQKRLKAITWRKIGENCAFTDLQRLQQFFFPFFICRWRERRKNIFFPEINERVSSFCCRCHTTLMPSKILMSAEKHIEQRFPTFLCSRTPKHQKKNWRTPLKVFTSLYIVKYPISRTS